MSYSPAIFQEAVKVVTDSLKENESFETDKMTIKVIKVMPSIDLNKIKTIDLITLEVQSKNKSEKPAKLQLHVYYTNQAIMIQGHRKIGGVKGFKLFFENFLQPQIELVVQNKTEQIDRTKAMLDKVGAEEKTETEENQKEEANQSKATKVAQDMINEIVNKASNQCKDYKSLSFDCSKCEGSFFVENKLKEHIDRVHTEKTNHIENHPNKSEVFMCEVCQTKLTSYREMSKHIEENHENVKSQSEHIPNEKSLLNCEQCQIKFQNNDEKTINMEQSHVDSIIQIESNNVIQSITEKFKKIQNVEKEMTEQIILKRANSVSPPGIKSKSSKIELIQFQDVEEDLKLVKQEVIELKTENIDLRKKLQDVESINIQNEQLRKQLKD